MHSSPISPVPLIASPGAQAPPPDCNDRQSKPVGHCEVWVQDEEQKIARPRQIYTGPEQRTVVAREART